jgi:hypothetical protein
VNERERDKNAARRLAILRHAEEVTGNVALTCRYYGITRQVFYLWRRRLSGYGPRLGARLYGCPGADVRVGPGSCYAKSHLAASSSTSAWLRTP